MTDPILQPSNETLRFLINEAVQREVVNVIAPLRAQQQVNDGMIRQVDRDLAGLKSTLSEKVDELDDLVRGNPKQNLTGLADQIKQTNALVASIREELAKAEKGREAVANQLQGAKYALSALALVTGLTGIDTLARLFKLIP
jgi:hypothetical protein